MREPVCPDPECNGVWGSTAMPILCWLCSPSHRVVRSVGARSLAPPVLALTPPANRKRRMAALLALAGVQLPALAAWRCRRTAGTQADFRMRWLHAGQLWSSESPTAPLHYPLTWPKPQPPALPAPGIMESAEVVKPPKPQPLPNTAQAPPPAKKQGTARPSGAENRAQSMPSQKQGAAASKIVAKSAAKLAGAAPTRALLGGSASSASGSTPTFAQQQLAEQRRQVAAARAELAAANRGVARSNSGVAGGGDSNSVPSLRHSYSAPACAAGDSAWQPAILPPSPPDFTAPDEFPMLGKSQAAAEGGAQSAVRCGSGAWAGELAWGAGTVGSPAGTAGSGAGTWPLDGQAAFDVGGTLVGSSAMATGQPPDVPAGMATGSTAPAGSNLVAPAPHPDGEASDDEANPADLAAALRQQQLLLQASWASGKACWEAPGAEPTPAPPLPLAGAISHDLAAEAAAPALHPPTPAGLAAQVQEERN